MEGNECVAAPVSDTLTTNTNSTTTTNNNRDVPILVKVYIRIRPPSSATESCSIQAVGSDQLIIEDSQKVFRFDRIFGPNASQLKVYEAAVHPLIHKFFEGINCTIFAYGQTGSGKTYTIGSGYYLGEEREGIIARTVYDIFKDHGRDHEVNRLIKVSYLEIYKEELRDLLQDCSYPSNKDIHIREDDNGQTIISGIVEEEVRSVEDALGWLECGNAARVTSATEMNTHSSRSHAVFTISLVQEKTVDYNGQEMTTRLSSKFHFVDLAGSERVSRTHNMGERFKESIHINGGLLALGNVISAFSDKRRRSTHIPYRDSKITRILKDSLGGSALTVMITCLSPSSADLPETLNALKYAKRARNIKNHPVVNHTKENALLYSMREEIQCLKDELYKVRETCPLPHSLPPIPSQSASNAAIPKVDSAVMVELGDNSSYLYSVKKKLQAVLHRQRAILDAAEASYTHCCSSMTTGGHHRKIEETVEKLYNFIKSNTMLHDELEAVSVCVTSNSTNTSTDCSQWLAEGSVATMKQTELDRALQTVVKLREELEISEEKVVAGNARCLKHTMELNVLKEECQNQSNEKEQLEREIEKLIDRVDFLQNQLSLTTVISHSEHSGSQHEACTVPDHHGQDIYSLIHGTVSNLQEYDEDTCDTVLRELTDILAASRYRNNAHQNSAQVGNCPQPPLEEVDTVKSEQEIDVLHQSIASSQHQLHSTEKRLLRAQHTMKSLNLKIRFKEELIKELVKNNSTFQCLNKAYQTKISNLEKEYDQLKSHIVKQKSSLKLAMGSTDESKGSSKGKALPIVGGNNEAGTKEEGGAKTLSTSRSRRRKSKSASICKADIEMQEKKLKETESKLLVLQRRRQETLRILNMGEKSEKRIYELEGEMERLRKQQGILKKKLKGELTKKRNLEDEVQQYKLKVKTLSESNKQQSRVIKVKTGEVALAQRKLRGHGMTATAPNQSISQKWIDQEIEKIVQERQALETFQKELLEREAVIKSQEALLQERNQLVRRCSNQSSETLRLSQQIESINQRIVTKEKLRASFSGQTLNALEEEIGDLRTKRTQLIEGLDNNNGSLNEMITGRTALPPDQEIRLMELTEQIEVLETLLQIKNRFASELNPSLSASEPSKNELHAISSKISILPSEEAKLLLGAYINKVIKLKQDVEKHETIETDLRNQISQQNEAIHQLEAFLDQAQVDKELRFTRLHKEHAKEVQLLLNQVAEREGTASKRQSDADDEVTMLRSKIKELERDLYYYKKTARKLKQHADANNNNQASSTSTGPASLGSVPSIKQSQPILKDSLEVYST